MLKATYSALTSFFEDKLEEFQGNKLSEEVQHVLDSLSYADTCDNELYGAIAVYNALSLFDMSPNKDQCLSSCSPVFLLSDAEKELNSAIEKHVHAGKLSLEWLACERCGKSNPFFTYGKDTDRDINTPAVFEFMHLSHMCDGCWQNCFYED